MQQLGSGFPYCGFSAAGKAGEPEKGGSMAVEAMAVGLLDAALEWEYVGFHFFFFLARISRITRIFQWKTNQD